MSLTGHRIFGLVVHKHFALTTSPYPQIGSRQPQKLPYSSTLLPTTRNVNIVATNIKHGG